MEEQYGMPLVDRSGNVIAATTAGDAVLRKARQILALEHDLRDELKNLGIKAHITLCCTPTFGIVYLPLVLHRFFLANCEVNIKSALKTPEEVLKGILANEFAVAVIEHCGKLETLDTVSFSLPPDELTFVSAPSLGLSGGTPTKNSLTEAHCPA
jgi:DNA-binding transcriptional LysR family regulator